MRSIGTSLVSRVQLSQHVRHQGLSGSSFAEVMALKGSVGYEAREQTFGTSEEGRVLPERSRRKRDIDPSAEKQTSPTVKMGGEPP